MSFLNAKTAMRLIIVFGIVVTIYTIFVSSKTAHTKTVPPYKLYTIDGNIVSGRDVSNKPYMLHFWAHWCDKCIEELDDLARLQNMFKGKFSIIAVHVGRTRKDRRLFRKILKNKDLNYKNYLDNGDAADQFGLDMVPASILIDKNGKVVDKILGPQDWGSKENIGIVQRLVD